MTNYLIFSDKLKQIGLFVKAQLLIVGRLLIILFKRRKKLEKISFGYYQKWHFDNAFLFVDFNFKNAVWFRIGNYKSNDFSKQIVLDLENIHTDTIPFEVFGFFQKQVYEINLNKEAKIETQSFKTKINNLNTFKLSKQNIKAQIPKIALRNNKLVLKLEKIQFVSNRLSINHKPFKTQDYI
ncbi:MAG: hypothetical protein HS118_09635 [Bacteroidia bacterium]|nr:hypothetical protein [Bacteroidia bacterium]